MKKPGLSRDHYLEMLQKTPHRYQMYLFALALNRRGERRYGEFVEEIGADEMTYRPKVVFHLTLENSPLGFDHHGWSHHLR